MYSIILFAYGRNVSMFRSFPFLLFILLLLFFYCLVVMVVVFTLACSSTSSTTSEGTYDTFFWLYIKAWRITKWIFWAHDIPWASTSTMVVHPQSFVIASLPRIKLKRNSTLFPLDLECSKKSWGFILVCLFHVINILHVWEPFKR